MDVRLAYHPEGFRTLSELTDHVGGEGQSRSPSLLVSFYYLGSFEKHRARYTFRDWVMDSGAYSAHNSGVTIHLSEYIDTCRRLIETDPSLTEVFALDVMSDWRAGLKNTEAMWAAGIPAIPTYHPGEPWSVLTGLARDYPKIALGGVVGWTSKRKQDHVGQCFARVWPKAIHGLGMSSEPMLMKFPFHSVDATNWEIGPCKFGRWQSFGAMSVRGSKQNLRAEVDWYLALERRARARWAAEAAKIPGNGTAALTCRPGSDATPAPSVRLALAGSMTVDKRYALGDDAVMRECRPADLSGVRAAAARKTIRNRTPTVRLALQNGCPAQVKRSGLTREGDQ